MGSWFRRLAYLLRYSRQEAELREEIETHRAMRAAQLQRDGMAPRDAAAASQRALGNSLLARDDVRDAWLGSWASWWQDLRFGLRSCRRAPAFTAVAVATLALGIGVNAGIFTILNGVLFRDVPAPGASELVSIAQSVAGERRGGARTGVGTVAVADYETYRDRARTLSGLLAHSNPMFATLGGSMPRPVSGIVVSCNYFTVLRQPPALGRSLVPQDCARGAEPVIVLGHEFWRTTFAADPGVVGRTVELNRRAFTVVGVAADGTYGASPFATGYFAPIVADAVLGPLPSRATDNRHLWLYLVGRRAPGAGLDRVRAELDVIADQIDAAQPGRTTTLAVRRATPIALSADVRPVAISAAAVLMAAFGIVLLIACANVANLMLARGTARHREIAVRLSLGASRGRVARQLLIESLVLAIAGGSLGSLLAFWSFQVLAGLALPATLPPWSYSAYIWDFSPDLRVLAFATAVTLGTGLLFGIVPAFRVSRLDLDAVIKQDVAGLGGGRRRGRLRAAFVGAQVALCMALMMPAGLLLRGLHAAYTIDPGFRYDDVAYVSLTVPAGAADTDQAAAVRARFAEEFHTLPGVEAVASAMQTPFGDEDFTVAIRLPEAPVDDVRFARMNVVAPQYFDVLGLPIVRGRNFTAAETADPAADERSTIVSAATARNLWPSRDPIGQRIQWGDAMLRVVGVTADAQVSRLGVIDPYYFYLASPGPVLLFKTRGGLDAITPGIRAIARTLDPGAAVTVLPLAANVSHQRALSGIVASIGTGLGLLALVLVAVGIYGVVSYAVTRRYREIGVRLALGASARNVFTLILGQSMRPVIVGSSLGIAMAVAMSSVLSSVLVGVSTADPVGLGGAALLVLGVALLSAAVAARPAVRADPTMTLRCD